MKRTSPNNPYAYGVFYALWSLSMLYGGYLCYMDSWTGNEAYDWLLL